MKYPYDTFRDDKIFLIAQRQRVYDVGGGGRFQKWLAQYEPLFAAAEYKTVDYDPATQPDIVADIHALPMQDSSADAVICYAVLAHVREPIIAVSEVRRILKPGGVALFYVPSIYPNMSEPGGAYPDNWRFFNDSLDILFADWTAREQIKVGGYFKALFFFVPMQHKLRWLLDPLAYALDTVFQTTKRKTTSGYLVFVTK